MRGGEHRTPRVLFSRYVSMLYGFVRDRKRFRCQKLGNTVDDGDLNNGLKFLDLFAGGGGLSEGFVQAGFHPVAHVESDPAACFTLRTRMAFHGLKRHDDLDVYSRYLGGALTREEFYAKVPDDAARSVINAEIGNQTLPNIFRHVDELLEGQKLDLIIGGPPCQAYSLVGRSRDHRRMRGDRRNYLYIQYAAFLKRYKPLFFVFENVAGLLSARDHDGHRYFDAMQTLFRISGYKTEVKTLLAKDYGVLQNRKRVFLVGRRGGKEGFFPEPEKWRPNATVNEVFSDLPELEAGAGDSRPCVTKPYRGTWQHDAGIRNDAIPVTWHQARPHSKQDLEIYRIAVELWNSERKRLRYNDLPSRLKTHRNRRSFGDRFKVVASNLEHSQTVVAHIAKDGHYYIHPDIGQNRSITPREAARLQTFPDDYYFESRNGVPARTPVFGQIGNAVPVLLARKVAQQMEANWT